MSDKILNVGGIRYSEHEHEHYLPAGQAFLGDLQRWNWRYMVKGVEIDHAYDKALNLHFNDSQRKLMLLPPMEAFEWYKGIGTNVDSVIELRMQEAQARLFPPLIAYTQGNVIGVNFKRHRS